VPDATILPLSAAKKIAGDIATDLASVVIHLFKDSIVGGPPTISTPLATFTAAECDFTGYAPVTVVAPGDLVQLGTAWAVVINTRFDCDPSSVTTGNSVGGAYAVSAGGVLYEFINFSPSRPMQAPGNACFVTLVLPITAQQVA
jgi:hypothetical protein